MMVFLDRWTRPIPQKPCTVSPGRVDPGIASQPRNFVLGVAPINWCIVFMML